MDQTRMKVACIIPPSSFLLDDKVFMTLGLLKVAAVMRTQLNAEVEVVDLCGLQDFDSIVDGITADVACITATTPQFPAALKISNRLKSRGIPTVMGGPHATMIASANRQGRLRVKPHFNTLLSSADVIVAGDGELAIGLALDKALKRQPGLIDADDPKSGMFMSHSQFNDSPWPARDLIDVSSYHYYIDGKRSLSVIGQLGCPMACNFCAGRSSPTFRRIRLRDPASVVSEVRHLVLTYGIRGIMFYDDELNINAAFSQLMTGLTDLQHELGMDLAFRGFVKSELFTREQAHQMSCAGFKTILSGFESGSPRILENINKKATVDDNTRCVDVAHEHGMAVKALMSIGHAGESDTTIEETVEWVKRTRPDDADVTIITPLPGSPYFDRSVETRPGVWTYTAENGDRLHSVDVDHSRTVNYYKGVPGNYESYVFTDHLSQAEIVSHRDRAEIAIRKALALAPLQVPNMYEHTMGMVPSLQGSMPKPMEIGEDHVKPE